MKKIITVILILAFMALSAACSNATDELSSKEKDVKKTESTVSAINGEQSKISKAEESAKSESSKSGKTEKLTKKQAQKIATDIIIKYDAYSSLGCCCDIEYIEGDFSKHLSNSQIQKYMGAQFKINCCKDVAGVKKHIEKYIDDSLKKEFDEDLFFYDDKGNFYVGVMPMGVGSFNNVRVVSYSNTKIVAKATFFDDQGEFASDKTFKFEKKGKNFKIVAD